MNPWEMWKKGFDAWEGATATYLEAWMKSPLLLNPIGAMLTASAQTKRVVDRASATMWGSMGLPTKRDQERALHALHQLESRLMDLEERLEDAVAALEATKRPRDEATK